MGRRTGRSGYQSYVSKGMKSLIAKGYTPSEAMKQVASQWRGRSGSANWGTPAGGKKGWTVRAHARPGATHKRYPLRGKPIRQPLMKPSTHYPKWEEEQENPRRKRKRTRRYEEENPKVRRQRRRTTRTRRTPTRRARPRRVRSRRTRGVAKSPAAFVPRKVRGVSYQSWKGLKGVKTAYGRQHLSFMSHCLKSGGNMKGCASKWNKQKGRYGKAAPKTIHHKFGSAYRVTRRAENPRRKTRRYKGRKRNPEFPTIGGFFPNFERIKKELLYFLPARSEFYPTWAEIKAHPIFTLLGLPIGGLSASMWGGVGRAMSGNAVISEVLGIAGNIIGTELPARFIKLFNFKGNHVLAKSIRFSGYLVTIVSTILGLIRIIGTMKKGGVKGLGEFKLPTLTAIPEAIKAFKTTLISGAIGVDNPLADLVTSGMRQGYTGGQPMGVSGPFQKPQTSYVGAVPIWQDKTLGDPTLVDKIQELANKLGLGADELESMYAANLPYPGTNALTYPGVVSSTPEDELPGLADTVVPTQYAGGFDKEFVK